MFEDLPASNEPSVAFFGNSRSLAATQYGSVSLNTGRHAVRADELKNNIRNFAIPTSRFSRMFSTWNPPSQTEGDFPQNYMIEQSRNRVSDMYFDKYSNPSTFQHWKKVSRPRYVPVQNVLTDAMLRIKEVEMIDSGDDLKTSRSIGGHRFHNFEILDAKITSVLKKIITNSTSRRESIWRSERHKYKFAFSVEDRLRTWSTNIFEWLEHMKLLFIIRICSVSLYMTTIFKILISEDTRLYYH